MNSTALPVNLNDEQIEAFGRELDALREEVLDSRGEADRRYILTLIRVQRSLALGGRLSMLASFLVLPVWGHALASTLGFWLLLCLGTAALGIAKILENMEIGHNVLHAQWDWMNDPNIQSSSWEWDHVCPSDQWLHSHNIRHHTWTNVMGKDPDIGYGLLRMTPEQRWRPFFLGQPLYAFLLAVLFEWGVAIQELEVGRLFTAQKHKHKEAIRPMLRGTGRKVLAQVTKDYLAWPLLGVALAAPLVVWGVDLSLWMVFFTLVGANAVAGLMRNLWAFMIIFCGHFPDDVHHFTKAQVDNETRARWYVRQLLGSCNINGGPLFHVMSGNLSHQIEHHLFPDLPSNRYPALALRVRAVAARYGLPYNSASLARQFGTTWKKIFRLSLPGGGVTVAA